VPPRNRHLATVSETTAALLEEERLEKSMEARKLRAEGYDWWEIADKMRLTPKNAREAVAYGIRAAAELVNDATKAELLDLELVRLDMLVKANMRGALQGDVPKGRFILDLVKERVRLLELDTAAATAGQTTVVIGGTSTEYIEALKAIAAYAAESGEVVLGELEEKGSA